MSYPILSSGVACCDVGSAIAFSRSFISLDPCPQDLKKKQQQYQQQQRQEQGVDRPQRFD